MTKTELRKHNENKLNVLSVVLESKIDSLLSVLSNDLQNIQNIEQFKQELLFSVAEIKKLCKSHSAVLRLAYMIYFFNLPEEKKEQYTRGLKKELCTVVFEKKESAENLSFIE